MPTVWKTALSVVVDAAATIGFLLLAIKPVAYIAGLAIACMVVIFSFFPVLTDYAHLANGSFEYTARLVSWFAIYAVLIFAIVMEVIRRLIGHERLSIYCSPQHSACRLRLPLPDMSGRFIMRGSV